MVDLTSEQTVLHVVLPILAVLVTLASPFFAYYEIRKGAVLDEMKAGLQRRLSFFALVIIFLSPVFLISNWEGSLYLFAVYSVLLALANLTADRIAKVRLLPWLLGWNTVNLLNLIGGALSIFQIYNSGSGSFTGIIGTVRSLSTCDQKKDYCDNTWISVQLVFAFFYVLLHVLAWFVVFSRTLNHYGGEEEAIRDGSLLE